MSNATIPLATPMDEKNIKFPGYLSVKLDGVPVRVDLTLHKGEIHYSGRTRQDEIVHSAMPAITEFINDLLETCTVLNGRHTFVFEITHPEHKAFKDVAGVVRRQSAQEGLVLNLFDYVNHDHPDMQFGERFVLSNYIMQHMSHPWYKACHQHVVWNMEDFRRVEAALLDRYPTCEGLVYRSADDVWAPNSRSKGYMKVLNEPMSDVEVVGFEEAVNAKTKQGKGMVGRVIIRWKDGKEHGVGPGKLTHDERTALWKSHGPLMRNGPRIAQIKHKNDDTYKGPRQGTFQCWRPEKKEPSYG